jgi:hypothetical protein
VMYAGRIVERGATQVPGNRAPPLHERPAGFDPGRAPPGSDLAQIRGACAARGAAARLRSARAAATPPRIAARCRCSPRAAGRTTCAAIILLVLQ